jgi:hypothetical protein
VLFTKPTASLWRFDDGLSLRCAGPQCTSSLPQRAPLYSMTPVEQLSTAFFLDVSLSNVTWLSGRETTGCGHLEAQMSGASEVKVVVFQVDTTTLDILSVEWVYGNGDFRQVAYATDEVDGRHYQPLERACAR